MDSNLEVRHVMMETLSVLMDAPMHVRLKVLPIGSCALITSVLCLTQNALTIVEMDLICLVMRSNIPTIPHSVMMVIY